MSEYKYIYKIPEEEITERVKYFIGYDGIIKKYISIANIVFEDNKTNGDILELLNISGKILMYGIPGTGKTSIAYCISKHFLENEVESYKISIPDLIKSNLGVTTENMKNAIQEILTLNEKGQMILILDEIDRISVERSNSNEISELKRAMIEFLDFLDGINHNHRMLIIGITNSLNYLDAALVRRFDFVDEIKPNNLDLVNLFKLIVSKLSLKLEYSNEDLQPFIEESNTGDKIKKYFKQLYIQNEGNTNTIEKEVEIKIRGDKK